MAVIGVASVAAGAASDSDARATASTATATQAPVGSLTADEAAGIVFMREEEKLAHDAYVTFADLYGRPIFSNIASAETTHMTAVLGLIQAHGLDDPTDGNEIGTFQNADLQQLYDDLITAGSVDLTAALQVGAIIEEVDILDLEERLAGTTGADIVRVYENLLRGSENHLRAFVSQLELAGIDRAPTHMNEDAYRAILGSGMDRGGSYGSGRNGDGACDESGHGQQGQGQGGRGLGGQGG